MQPFTGSHFRTGSRRVRGSTQPRREAQWPFVAKSILLLPAGCRAPGKRDAVCRTESGPRRIDRRAVGVALVECARSLLGGGERRAAGFLRRPSDVLGLRGLEDEIAVGVVGRREERCSACDRDRRASGIARVFAATRTASRKKTARLGAGAAEKAAGFAGPTRCAAMPIC